MDFHVVPGSSAGRVCFEAGFQEGRSGAAPGLPDTSLHFQ